MMKLIILVASLAFLLIPADGFVPSTKSTRVPRKAPVLDHPSIATLHQLHPLCANKQDNDKDLLSSNNYLTSDLFAIVIASELIGLLDSVNDPTWQGWFSPISGVPATINILIVRFSLLSILWVTGNVVSGVFSADSKPNDNEMIQSVVQAGVVFSILRIMLELAMVGTDADWGILLRDCYVVTLATAAFRFLYAQVFL